MQRSNIKTVLSLDPAASTGYCIASIDGDTYSIFEYGIIDVDKVSDYLGDECISMMEQVKILIEKHNVNHVTIEDYFFSKRFAQGADVNVAYRTAIYILCRQLGLEYSILNIGSWKNLVAGRSTPTKEQKAKWGKEPAKKLMIQEALWKHYGFKFPNHSISSKTNKPINFRYDVVDAVGQAVYFARQFMDIQNVKLLVQAPPDVDFGKRKSKKLFTY